MNILKAAEFVDKLEDEICSRLDIDDFEAFMTAISKELFGRYLMEDK